MYKTTMMMAAAVVACVSSAAGERIDAVKLGLSPEAAPEANVAAMRKALKYGTVTAINPLKG